jgi:hypothetical protein
LELPNKNSPEFEHPNLIFMEIIAENRSIQTQKGKEHILHLAVPVQN